jgi:hypothetical protein
LGAVCKLTSTEDIKKALKAIDLMKILDGQVAVGNKSNSRTIGEHKVSFTLCSSYTHQELTG